jgi:hypothetical protein
VSKQSTGRPFDPWVEARARARQDSDMIQFGFSLQLGPGAGIIAPGRSHVPIAGPGNARFAVACRN